MFGIYDAPRTVDKTVEATTIKSLVEVGVFREQVGTCDAVEAVGSFFKVQAGVATSLALAGVIIIPSDHDFPLLGSESHFEIFPNRDILSQSDDEQCFSVGHFNPGAFQFFFVYDIFHGFDVLGCFGSANKRIAATSARSLFIFGYSRSGGIGHHTLDVRQRKDRTSPPSLV